MGGMFGGDKKVSTPTILTPVMPATDTDTIDKARKKAAAAAMAQSGRSSTVLSGSDGLKLGGG
jgi:hypothetical protein